jgi:hypothetical protein
MEKKVIDLEVIEDLLESGTQKISLVDSPAIEKDWLYFKKLEFVEPSSGESQSDYMGRCVPYMIGEGKDQDQAVAICISTYENMASVDGVIICDECGHSWDIEDGGDDVYICHKCGYENFGIDTGGLAPYVQQAGKKKDEDDLVSKPVNFSNILSKAKDLGFSAEDFTTNGLAYHEDVEGIDLKLAKGYTVYKYTGSVGSDTRDFCRDMVNMDRFYTFDEINQLSSSDPNPGFGLGGSDNYSLWKYKGGPNCKHRWTKFYVTETGDIENKGAAPGTAGEKPENMSNSGYAFAEVADLKVGDDVSWKTADTNPRGRITDIAYDSKKVPGVDFVIEGTKENPGFIIEIYEEVEGEWKGTGKYVGRKADSILKNVKLSIMGITPAIQSELRNKINTHNKNNLQVNKKADLDVLRKIWERGAKDYASNRVNTRGMSIEDWAMERVDDYLKTLASTAPASSASRNYKKDNDLLPKTHPGYSYFQKSVSRLNFASEDKRELVGAVAIPDMEIPRKDKDGNIFFVRFSKEVVAKMARKFMKEQRLSDNNIQHIEDMDAGSYVYESWVTENMEDKANTVYGMNVPVGTWVVKMKVLNDETWKKVKDGDLNGFSLEGSFLSQDEYTAYLQDKKMYEELVELIAGM